MTDTTTQGEQIGSVISLNGSVWAESGTSHRPLTEGAPVYEGEKIVTESDSNVEIKFADNTVLGQGEDSVVRLDDYVYSEDANQLDFKMMQGVMRVVSGEIVKINPEGFNLSTPLATIGIRGTQVMIQVDQGREFIGVDQLGEGHTVIIGNAFNQVIIDKAGMFSGVDFDGSLIAPDEMPDSFIQTITRAAPLTILGDPPRFPGDPQGIIPPNFFETIDNQSGEYQPGVGMEYAEEDVGDEYEDVAAEKFDLTEAEIEALIGLETAAGTEEGGPAQEFGQVVDVAYNPYHNDPGSNEDTPDYGGGENEGDRTATGDDDPPPPNDPPAGNQLPEQPILAEDAGTDQPDEQEDAPVSYNVIAEGNADGNGAILVSAELAENSDFEGEVEFAADGSITYVPVPGESGSVVINYTVEDIDGNTATAHLTIDLAQDSEPAVTVTGTSGDESDGLVTATGTIDVDFGADEIGSSLVLAATGATWNNAISRLTANDNSWLIDLTGDTYEFIQLAPLDHGEGDLIDIDVTVTATDGDGSVSTGTFSIAVNDDGPTATDVVFVQDTAEDTLISYNVITEGNADLGIDSGTLVGAALVEGSDHAGNVAFNEDGTITYTPVQGETGTVVIDYTVEDTDGDTASAQLSIELAEDSEPVIEVVGATGDEADGLATASGTIDIDFGADADGATIELSSDVAEWDSESKTLIAEDSSWQIALTATGYQFTQYEPFDHSDGDEYGIDVTITATDGDGTVSHGDFTVTVSDDGPTASDALVAQDEADESVSYNVFDAESATTGIDGGYLVAAELSEDSEYNGDVEFDADGTITYHPDEGETGTVLIDYTVEDNDGDTALAQLAIELAEPEEPLISDVMTGQGGEVLIGGDGDDTIDGAQGRDAIFGTGGDDELIGGNSPDALFGDAGDDTLDGGRGNDELTGGIGDDVLTGGQGNDTFVFTSPDDGTDSILDFNSARDQIALYEATFDLFCDEQGNLDPNQFTTVLDTTFAGGYDFEDATSGLVYASDEGSHIGALFYDPNDTISGDEILLAEVTEDGGDSNIEATDIDIV